MPLPSSGEEARSEANLRNTNVYSTSRVYADFAPLTGGGPAVNLPVLLEDGANPAPSPFSASASPVLQLHVRASVNRRRLRLG